MTAFMCGAGRVNVLGRGRLRHETANDSGGRFVSVHAWSEVTADSSGIRTTTWVPTPGPP
jgi:hypothetical protein